MKEQGEKKQIHRTDIFNIHFYEKTWFHGSFLGMHYRIEKIADENEEKMLRVTTWPGPYNFEHTDDSLKKSAVFAFSDEGLDAVTDYLNRYHEEYFENRK